MDKVMEDIKEKRLSADDVYDRATWRCTQHKRGNMMKEKKRLMLSNVQMRKANNHP